MNTWFTCRLKFLFGTGKNCFQNVVWRYRKQIWRNTPFYEGKRLAGFEAYEDFELLIGER